MIHKLAILTSGGDAPGMNAAIYGATLAAHRAGLAVVGVERGFRGLIDGRFLPMGPTDVAGILREGGTILGSARCLEFHHRNVRDGARATLAANGIDAVLVIGGNGSLTGAMHLGSREELGPQALAVMGLPGSIDNDLGITSECIGVDTALNTIVEACDKIADTATAHDRTFIIEVMGRDCGYLAMTAATAVGADVVLFPEVRHSEAEIVASIVTAVYAARAEKRRGRRVIVIKAEGVAVPVERVKVLVDQALAAARPADEPDAVETRVTVLGHVVRGGRPSAFDRLLASRLATCAVQGFLEGQTLRMSAWMPVTELPEEIGARSTIDPYVWLVDIPAVLAETENLVKGRTPLSRWRAGVAYSPRGEELLV